MNVNLLIDSLVRQTTVLIAQLATGAGGRPSLAHTANQVFVSLVKELKEQGVGNKVIADMFGLALRTYHAKVRRLEESATYGGRSLWEAILEHVQQQNVVSQSEVLRRFRNDDHATVKSILHDLMESGLVFKTGRGSRVTYRAASAEEVVQPRGEDAGEGLVNMVWVSVNRLGPARLDQLLQLAPMDESAMLTALDTLIADGRVIREQQGEQSVYSCDGCFIRAGDPHGWEAAIFDHYQAMVTSICKKLDLGPAAEQGAQVGGSTISFFVWDEHPMQAEVYGLLEETRARLAALRERVATYNHKSGKPQSEMTKVITYVGQTFLEPEEQEESNEE